jgi:formamidopyrimidine-DNA glycosylase
VARDGVSARVGADSKLPLNAGEASVPELPDIVVYIDALESRVVGEPIERIRVLGPFLLRTAVPPISSAEGRRVVGLRRIGKRIVLALEGELFLVLHLMVAGRLRWLARSAKPPGRITLAVFEFRDGRLVFTEAGTKRRASLHLVQGEPALAAMDPGGLELLEADRTAFAARLGSGNHTLKRALTDPRLFSGIGNAYSDEILHRAQLSPVALTSSLSEADVTRLHDAARAVLAEWTDRLRAENGDGFPEKVTAFRDGMTVHGRYRQPCPVCGAPVQRIVYAENEANYCARCQTGGKILADRALSRLLHKSWPRSIDELE